MFEKCEYRVLLDEMGRFEMLKVWLCAIFLSFTIKCTQVLDTPKNKRELLSELPPPNDNLKTNKRSIY